MVTNIAVLQMKNNFNIINQFSKRRHLIWDIRRMFLSFENEHNCVKNS